MPENIDIESPEELAKLLEDATPELEAVDKSRFVRRAVLRRRAVDLTKILLTSWAPLAPSIDKVLSPEDAEQRKTELARLHTRVWVFYAADLASEEIHSNTNRKKRDALAKKVKEHDRFLFKWALPFFGDDPSDAETLRDISRGTGRRDDAEDVVRLANLFRENQDRWIALEDGEKKLNLDYIKQAAVDATKQLAYLSDGLDNPARVLADAAYSLWYYDYDELMHLGRYLTRRQADSMERFPGIRELPSVPVAVVAEEEDEVEDDEDEGEVEDDEDEEVVVEEPKP